MTTGRPVRIRRFGPSRPWFLPGSMAELELDLVAAARIRVTATVELLDIDVVVERVVRMFRLAAGAGRRAVRIPLPEARRHGYGLRLALEWPGGRASATAAVEALDGWWESPRHAAMTDFRSPRTLAARVAALRDWHVTVVQDYDWMYRHYRYEPPAGTSFIDALGRRVSHNAVRAGVHAGHRVGIATLAYGSVYGAEREYVDEHPDERVFDEAGVPLSLGETFYINDLRPGRPWRRRLLDEYVRACRRFGFDGVHMDTYGPPHRAVAFDGEPIDFGALYAGLIADAAERVAGARPSGRVLFNCVEGFPLEAVASAPAAALYLELWPPDERYADVVRWIERARASGDGRQVVIAAYISALRDAEHDPARRSGAVEAAILLTSVISAAGGYHHVLAEHERVLVEGYYPEARRLRAREAADLRSAWVFGARYVHLLSGPGLEPVAGGSVELVDAAGHPIPTSDTPAAGAVWVRPTRTENGTRVLHLVDLRAQVDDRWDAIRQVACPSSGWRLRWPEARTPVAMSPWTAGGDAAHLRPADGGTWALPAFRRWLVAADRNHLNSHETHDSRP